MTIVPSLGLAKKTIADFDIYGADIISQMTGNPNFMVTLPTIADVTLKHGEYHTAVVAAEGGTAQQKVTRNLIRKQLHKMLTDLAYNVATLSNNDLSIYLTSGFDYKKPPVPSGGLANINDFRFDYTDNEADGELTTRHSKVKGALMYELWIGTTPVPPAAGGGATNPTPGPTPGPATWWMYSEPSSTTKDVTGLTSGTRYYGYCVAKGSDNRRSNPSNIATKICP
jgi:hypothetical protein